MSIESPSLDDLLEQLIPDVEDSAPSEVPAGAEEPVSSDEALDVQPDSAVADESLPVSTSDSPAPDYTAQMEAMQAQLDKVQEKAQQFDRLEQLAREQAEQKAEQEKFAAWQQRMDEMDDLPQSQRDAEKQRIISEVSQYRDEQYKSDLSARDSAAEDAAKSFAALWTVAKQNLAPEQFTALEADAKHLLQFSSPDAMQNQLTRDRQLEKRGYERALAEVAKKQEANLAVQAQTRIASGADLVGAGVGAPASGKSSAGSVDEILDQIFG